MKLSRKTTAAICAPIICEPYKILVVIWQEMIYYDYLKATAWLRGDVDAAVWQERQRAFCAF